MLSVFLASVEETIGSDYELVVVDNSENRYDIFSAYNYGVAQSKGDILLFAHEDLVMRSHGWGAALEQYMVDDPEIGMIGVVGTQCLSKAPRGWNTFGVQGRNIKPICRLVQMTINSEDVFEGEKGFRMTGYNPDSVEIIQAMAVDGLFFAIRRSLFDNGSIRFDEETYGGFHVYDIDISMQVAQHKKVMIMLDVELKHISVGSYDKKYYESYYKYYMKWKDLLPMAVHQLPDPANFDQCNAMHYFRGMVKSGFFTKEEIHAYAEGYYATITGEPKTLYYYAIKYYTSYYNRLGIRSLASRLYKLFNKS